MRAATIWGGDGVGSIALEERPVPEPGPGQALVRLKAATLNYRDLLAADGRVPGLKAPRYVPLSCAVGEVAAVAPGVTRVKPGDRVSPLFAQGWLAGPPPAMTMLGGPIDGVARDWAVFDAESLCGVPDAIGDLDAATLPCAGLTAWSALFGPRPVQPGEWVLVQGTGGVAMAALQWAKAAGARVIVTSSSDRKLARATALGADAGINYRQVADWPRAARDVTGGDGVHILVDVAGSAGTEAAASAVADGGIIAAVGRLTGKASWGREVGRPVLPIVVGRRDAHEDMLAFCAAHAIRPAVETAYPLERLGDAMHHLRSGAFVGKIAVTLA